MGPAAANRVSSAGVDLADVHRLALAIERSGGRLIQRVFAADEHRGDGTPRDIRSLAAAFGVKESVVKVVGGLPEGAGYADICVHAVGAPDSPDQQPVRLRGELARWADEQGVELVCGSAPVTEGLVLSWALAVRREPEEDR